MEALTFQVNKKIWLGRVAKSMIVVSGLLLVSDWATVNKVQLVLLKYSCSQVTASFVEKIAEAVAFWAVQSTRKFSIADSGWMMWNDLFFTNKIYSAKLPSLSRFPVTFGLVAVEKFTVYQLVEKRDYSIMLFKNSCKLKLNLRRQKTSCKKLVFHTNANLERSFIKAEGLVKKIVLMLDL